MAEEYRTPEVKDVNSIPDAVRDTHAEFVQKRTGAVYLGESANGSLFTDPNKDGGVTSTPLERDYLGN